MDGCLSLEQFERHASGKLTVPEKERFERHLEECEDCSRAYQEGVDRNKFLLKMKSILGGRKTESRQEPTRHIADTRQIPLSWSVDVATGLEVPRTDYLPHIEGYTIHKVLGRGGMGVVYEATQAKLNRTVAIKLLPAIVGSSHPQTIERFQREAAAAARLHHRNIISIHDFGEARDGYYYAMELIEGQTIATMIKRLAADPTRSDSEDSIAALLRAPYAAAARTENVALDESGPAGHHHSPKSRFYYTQVAHWIAQVADGLQYAHLNGLIHRDIKPSNIMLGTDGRILVLDFGLVKASGDESVTVSGSLVGTYRYMSPEQLGASRIPVDARTDVYSLGATLYELLTFEPAFLAKERPELLSEIMFREATRPRKIVGSVPIELENICLKAMEKAPASRYQSAGAMAEDLRRYINDLPIIARKQSPLRRGFKFLRRHRLGAAATAVIVVLALGVVLSVWYQQRTQRNRLEALLGEGRELMGSYKWQEAETRFDDVLKLDPDNFAALGNSANVKKERYYQEHDPELLDGAYRAADRALTVDPNRHEVWNLKGIILREQNRLAEAELALKRALELDPQYYPTWGNLGSIHALNGDLAELERCFVECDKCQQKFARPDVKSRHNIAAVQLLLDDPAAEETLQNAWLHSDYDKTQLLQRPHLLLLWAKVKLRFSGTDGAPAAWEDSIAAFANSPSQLLRARSKRFRGLAELRREKWDEAINSCRLAIDLGDQRSYPLLVISIAQARLGNLDGATKTVRIANANWPGPLQRPGTWSATAENGVLWFETADELLALRREAESLIGAEPPEK